VDRHRRMAPKFFPNDWVMLNCKNLHYPNGPNKLWPRFEGPFRVNLVLSDLAVELDLGPEYSRVHPRFHANLLRPI
jgi:hypothetical protein